MHHQLAEPGPPSDSPAETAGAPGFRAVTTLRYGTPSDAALPRPAAARPPTRRWSLSAWSFVRRSDARSLASGGLLGGSQAGARLTFRLNQDAARPLALSARLATPIGRRAGSEAALGLDWQPSSRLPFHLLAERRQALGREGRSAFALVLHGGVSEAELGGFRLDGYAQAGLIGVRSRDPFGDGSVRLTVPVRTQARLGVGTWAAAQPGSARLEIGPHATLSFPLAGRNTSIAIDWRVRIAGDARPGGGPALTLASEF